MRAWVGLSAGALQLHVDAAGARYPLRIDPLIQQVKLGGEKHGSGRFGISVQLSGDGSTALVGEPRASSEVGAAWVFARTGSTWSEQGELRGSGKFAGFFGRSVALSGDGSTALVGEPGHAANTGAAWVFVRTGTEWSLGEVVEGEGEVGAAQFGSRVTLSADGHTALVAGIADSSYAGAVWVFTGSGSNFKQIAELTGGGESGAAQFGRGLALSSDGTTALISGPRDSGRTGAAWMFARSGSTWTQQAELKGSEEGGKGQFGGAAALSSSGNTALIGGHEDVGGVGAAWVFQREGTSWSQQGPSSRRAMRAAPPPSAARPRSARTGTSR